MMEKKRIGSNAGKVWRILNEKGEQSMFTLCHELGLTFEDVAIAIGWLASVRIDAYPSVQKSPFIFVSD